MQHDDKCTIQRLVSHAVPLSLTKVNKPVFQSYDLTVMVCSHSRTDKLPELLKRFANQKYQGTFELILWNNNYDTRCELDELYDQFSSKLDIKLIHSTENYYCIARIAALGLMRSELLLICDDDVIPEADYISRFLETYDEHGPDVVLGITGDIFLPHVYDQYAPEKFWQDRSYRMVRKTSDPACEVHYLHANNCLIPRHLLAEVARFPLPHPAMALIDDYWMSYIFSNKLNIPLMTIKMDDVMEFDQSYDDPNIALWLNPNVIEQKINFYTYHMRNGWPNFESDRVLENAGVSSS